MKTIKELETTIDQLSIEGNAPIQYDEEALLSAFNEDNHHKSVGTTILSVVGGIMVSLFSLLFIAMTNIYDSSTALIVLGAILFAGTIYLSRKITSIFYDTISVCTLMISAILIIVGLSLILKTENAINGIFLILSLISLIANKKYILSFISLIAFNASIIFFIINNNWFDAYYFQVTAIALLLYYISYKEGTIITKSKELSLRYSPIHTGLMICLVVGLYFARLYTYDFNITFLHLIPNITFLILIFLQIPYLLTQFDIQEKKAKGWVYVITTIALLTMANYAPMTGSLFLLLISFRFNHKIGITLAIISFVFYTINYYYSISLTLFTKSMLMMLTGIVFIGIFLITNKKWSTHESK